jgi:molybdenum cofactor cytidylyltransferase
MNPAALSKPRIVILAAGFSSRLGHPKALARVRDVSLLRRTLALMAPFASSAMIVVVPRAAARYRIEARGFDVWLTANSRRAAGLSSSVHRGIRAARYAPALLLLPVDLVQLSRVDVRRLLSCWRASRRSVVARRVGNYGGTPLILPRWLFARALEVGGDVGLREWLGDLPATQKVLLKLPSAALDVDTPQDLRAARLGLRRYSRAL